MLLQQRLDLSIASPQAVLLLPEYALPVLIHVLAHLPSFTGDRENNYRLTQKYLSFFYDVLLAGADNFSFIAKILETIKIAADATDSNNTVRGYVSVWTDGVQGDI